MQTARAAQTVRAVWRWRVPGLTARGRALPWQGAAGRAGPGQTAGELLASRRAPAWRQGRRQGRWLGPQALVAVRWQAQQPACARTDCAASRAALWQRLLLRLLQVQGVAQAQPAERARQAVRYRLAQSAQMAQMARMARTARTASLVQTQPAWPERQAPHSPAKLVQTAHRPLRRALQQQDGALPARPAFS